MSKQLFVILSTTEGQIYLTHTATTITRTLAMAAMASVAAVPIMSNNILVHVE
jgi:hypothetical protein